MSQSKLTNAMMRSSSSRLEGKLECTPAYEPMQSLSAMLALGIRDACAEGGRYADERAEVSWVYLPYVIRLGGRVQRMMFPSSPRADEQTSSRCKYKASLGVSRRKTNIPVYS